MRTEADVHSAIVDALVALGSAPWDDADPYLLRHLPAHAAASARTGELVADPDFCASVVPDELRRALLADGAATDRARGARESYLRVAHELGEVSAAERRAILAFTSASEGGEPPALFPSAPWWPLAVRYQPTTFALPLTGHTNGVEGVAFGTVGDRVMLASASYDNTVRLWDPASGQGASRTERS